MAKIFEFIGFKLVDVKIAHLIYDLNDWGFNTEASCEGKRTISQFDTDEHTHTAYIFFKDKLPSIIAENARIVGLDVYGNDRGIASMQDVGWRQHPTEPMRYIACHSLDLKNDIINANSCFESKIRDIFEGFRRTNHKS